MEPASATVEARSPSRRTSSSGRGADERGVAAAGAVDVAGREAGAQHAEHRGAVVRRGRVDGDLAGEHDLLERPGPDAARPRGRPPPRSAPAARSTRSGTGRSAPGRAAAAAPSAGRRAGAPRARRSCSGTSSGAASSATVRRTSRPRRASATSGTTSPPGREAGPVRRRAAPRAANGKPPTATSPAPARAVGSVGDRVAGQPPPRLGDRGEALAARRAEPRSVRACAGLVVVARWLEPRRAPERGERRAVAVGLLEAEPVVAGEPRGEHDRARVDVRRDRAPSSPASTPRPARRARRTARSQRSSSSARAAPWRARPSREAAVRARADTALQGTASCARPAYPGAEGTGPVRSEPARHPERTGPVPRVGARARSRRDRARWRSRPCAPSRPGRTGGPCARTPRSCRGCR